MNINHAMVAAFERSKKPERHSSLRAFTILLMGVFFIALMACLAIGVHVYGKAAAVQQHTSEVHVQSGFLSNVVHAADAKGSVTRAQGPEGPALVLVEALSTGTYETRIYCYQGTVYQEYAIAGHDYNPSSATPLFDSATFDFTMNGQLLSIATDQGTVDVALRSAQGTPLPDALAPDAPEELQGESIPDEGALGDVSLPSQAASSASEEAVGKGGAA